MRSCVAVSRWRTFVICGPAGHSLGWGRLPESHLSTRSEHLAPLLPPWGSAQDLTSQPQPRCSGVFHPLLPGGQRPTRFLSPGPFPLPTPKWAGQPPFKRIICLSAIKCIRARRKTGVKTGVSCAARGAACLRRFGANQAPLFKIFITCQLSQRLPMRDDLGTWV